MQPQQHSYFLHPNDYPAQVLTPSIPNGSKPKRSRSPIEVLGVSNNPTATATAVGSTGTPAGRARRRGPVGDASTYAGRDVASVERVFQQQPQQQHRRLQHHRGNGRFMSEAERSRDPDGGIATVHQARNLGASRPRRPPGGPKEATPKPPPMLNMEQQTHLKHVQGRYFQERPLVNTFTVHLDHHPQRSSAPQESAIWSTSGHYGALPIPRYVNLMPAASASPHAASTSILKVPVFSTLSEALHHQREQHKRQAQAGQHQNSQHPTTFVAHEAHAMTPHAPEVLYADVSQQHQRQLQHRRPSALQPQHRKCSLPTAERSQSSQQGGFGYGYDGRVSPTSLTSQVVPQQPLRQQRVPSAITAPPNCNTIAAPAAPVTPVMVYSHPHGYFMAYPPMQVQTPHSTRSQVQQDEDTWNPYESVSPSGESCKGFGRRDSGRDGKEDASREASPVMCPLSLASHDDEHDDKHDDKDVPQEGKCSNVRDVRLNQGRSEQQRDQEDSSAVTIRPEPLRIEDSINQEGAFKTPRRPREDPNSRGTLAQGSEDESQNGNGKDSGKENVCCNGEEQLLGKKRGGDQIAKQKSFSGSYFQVSPTSFLQPSKRQRNTSSRV